MGRGQREWCPKELNPWRGEHGRNRKRMHSSNGGQSEVNYVIGLVNDVAPARPPRHAITPRASPFHHGWLVGKPWSALISIALLVYFGFQTGVLSCSYTSDQRASPMRRTSTICSGKFKDSVKTTEFSVFKPFWQRKGNWIKGWLVPRWVVFTWFSSLWSA